MEQTPDSGFQEKPLVMDRFSLEHKTCDILAAERLRLMRLDNRLIIDSFQKAICILKRNLSINDKFKTEKYESTSTQIHFQKCYIGSIYCRNGDTLGPVELIVWLEQGNQGDQGDQREQDDQGEVSVIIF